MNPLDKLNALKSKLNNANENDNENSNDSQVQPKQIEQIESSIIQDNKPLDNQTSQAVQISQNINPDLLERISELQAALELANQDIRTNLIVIHRELAKDPAIVTILTPEQRRVIFQGYKKQAGIEIVAAATKSKAKKKQVDVSDFM